MYASCVYHVKYISQIIVVLSPELLTKFVQSSEDKTPRMYLNNDSSCRTCCRKFHVLPMKLNVFVFVAFLMILIVMYFLFGFIWLFIFYNSQCSGCDGSC